MRTTVTLDPDTAALVQAKMRTEGVSFKEALKAAIRAGAAARQTDPFRTRASIWGAARSTSTTPLTASVTWRAEERRGADTGE